MDALSGYDVVLVVEDIRPLFTDKSWLGNSGEVLVSYWDPIHPHPDHDIEHTGNVVRYADGLRIDFRLWPDEQTCLTLVNDFCSAAPDVAKCLLRDEPLPAKWCLDYDIKHVYLRPMLEWRTERDHGWSEPTGNLGKGLKKLLPPEIWEQLKGTCVGAEIEEKWGALFRTMALFARGATEVGEGLGYAYPRDLDRRVGAYVCAIKESSDLAGGARIQEYDN